MTRPSNRPSSTSRRSCNRTPYLLSLPISNTELSTLAVAKQLSIYGLIKAGTQKKKGVTVKRKRLTITLCHAPGCLQSERLPTSPIKVMHAFLLRLLHQNMQYVLLPLYLLQVAFVCRIYRMSETKHRSLAMLATTIIALKSSRLLCLPMNEFFLRCLHPYHLHLHLRSHLTTQPIFCRNTSAKAPRSRPLPSLALRFRSHDRRVFYPVALSAQWARSRPPALSQLRRARDGLPLLALGAAT
jgi:hypothetical protein